MFWILLMVAVGLPLAFWATIYLFKDNVAEGVLWFIGCTITLAVVFVGPIPEMFAPRNLEVTHRTSLVALRDTDGLPSFFLSSGRGIGTQSYFVYYVLNPDGSASPDRMEARRDVRVYQEDRSDGQIIATHWEGKWSFWSLPWITPTDEVVEFHIPNGSIKTGYRLAAN